ncbi:MAG: hypothetical protein ACR2LT_06135 [Pyrinomonadaceae bacterium]
MNKLILAFCLTIILSIFAFAQSSDDFHKGEFSVNFSHNQVDTGINDNAFNSANSNNNSNGFFSKRQGFNGVEVSGVGNVSRYFGIKGDFSANYKTYKVDTPGFTPSQFNVKASLYNVLGGVQIKNNSTDGSRFRPFAHALAGFANGRTKLDNSFLSSSFCQQAGVDCSQNSSISRTGFAAAIGGGVDIKADDRFSIRAIQIDYNPTRLGGSTQNNVRFGFGVVLH